MGNTFGSVLPSGGIMISFSFLRPVPNGRMAPWDFPLIVLPPPYLWGFTNSFAPHWWRKKEALVWLGILLFSVIKVLIACLLHIWHF